MTRYCETNVTGLPQKTLKLCPRGRLHCRGEKQEREGERRKDYDGVQRKERKRKARRN